MDSVFIHWNRVHWTGFLFDHMSCRSLKLSKHVSQKTHSPLTQKTHSLSHSLPLSVSLSLSLYSILLRLTLIPSRFVAVYLSHSHSLSCSSIAVTPLLRRHRPSISSPSLSQQPQGIILIWSLLCGFWVLYHCMNDCLDCLCVLEKWVVVVGFAYFLFLMFFFFFWCNVNWVKCLNRRLMGFWIFIFIKCLLLLLLLLYIFCDLNWVWNLVCTSYGY